MVAPEVFREGLHALPSPSGAHSIRSLFVRELVMRTSPSIAPYDGHEDVYIVLDDFGSLGRAWRETDEAGASRTSLIRNLLDGQYEKPVCVVAFNTSEGWSRDVSVEIADELRRRFVEQDDVPESLLTFMEAANRH
jgi:hypothetical protein